MVPRVRSHSHAGTKTPTVALKSRAAGSGGPVLGLMPSPRGDGTRSFLVPPAAQLEGLKSHCPVHAPLPRWAPCARSPGVARLFLSQHLPASQVEGAGGKAPAILSAVSSEAAVNTVRSRLGSTNLPPRRAAWPGPGLSCVPARPGQNL